MTLRPLAPINEKIPVRRENLAVVVQLRHANKTRIGQAHRLVGIFAEKIQNIGTVFIHAEVCPHRSTLQHLQKRFNAHSIGSQQKQDF